MEWKKPNIVEFDSQVLEKTIQAKANSTGSTTVYTLRYYVRIGKVGYVYCNTEDIRFGTCYVYIERVTDDTGYVTIRINGERYKCNRYTGKIYLYYA